MGIRDSRTTFPNLKRRRAVAKTNAEARATLTPAQKLERLDRGGYRAVRERVRLQK